MLSKMGLKGITTKDLKLLLGMVHRRELLCPITSIGLATTGLLRLGDDLGHLRGLDSTAVCAVLVAVIAERPAERPPEPQ